MCLPQKIHWQVSQSQKLSLIFRKVEFSSGSYLVIEHSATHGFGSIFSISFLCQVSVEDHKVHSARASQSHHNLPSSDAPMMGHNLRADIINPMAGQPTPQPHGTRGIAWRSFSSPKVRVPCCGPLPFMASWDLLVVRITRIYKYGNGMGRVSHYWGFLGRS